ncbi:hypothetical protein [Actinomadura sp. NPDC000600]|uniref:hypothetical protein n=1 Tax=Actinomadura sp. NPDC000600 TaxID=3154262 RepID=UPI003394642B
MARLLLVGAQSVAGELERDWGPRAHICKTECPKSRRRDDRRILLIPSYSVEVSAQVPAGASFWMPSKSEYDETAEVGDSGFGFFGDTWVLMDLTTEEAGSIVAEERELLPLVDRYSRTPEEFEETVTSLESPDLPECQPDRLRDTPLWDRIVDETGTSREPAFGGLEFGVAGVPPTQVAQWAGHSVEVLLKIYAKVIVGQDRVWEGLIDDALGD